MPIRNASCELDLNRVDLELRKSQSLAVSDLLSFSEWLFLEFS